MALSLAMLSSVFAGTSAFATYTPGTPVEATITQANDATNDVHFLSRKLGSTGEYTGIYEEVTGAGDVKFYETGTDTEATKFYIGEQYDIKITQTAAQKANYILNGSAEIAVKLEDSTNGWYDYYDEEISLVEKDGAYLGTFTALGDAKKVVASTPAASRNIINIYGEKQKSSSDAVVSVVANEIVDENNGTVVANASQFDTYSALKKGEDFYIQLLPVVSETTGSLIQNVKPVVIYKSSLGTDVDLTTTATATPSFNKGLGVYKISGSDVTAIIEALNEKSAKEATITLGDAEAKFTSDPVTITLPTDKSFKFVNEDGTIDDTSTSKKPMKGATVTLKYTGDSENFDGFTATTPASVEGKQYVDTENKIVSFLAYENYAISSVKESTAATKGTLRDKVTSEQGFYTMNGGESITGNVGDKVELKVRAQDYCEFRAFPLINDEVKFYQEAGATNDISSNGWKAEYKGFEIDTTSTPAKTILTYDLTLGTGEAYLKLENAPSRTNEKYGYVPAVRFDQRIDSNSKANVKLDRLGTDGVVVYNQEQDVEISYKSDTYGIKSASIKKDGTKASVSEFDTTTADTATAKITPQTTSGLFKISSTYTTGGINVNAENGKVKVTDDKEKVIEQSLPGDVVYLTVTAKENYKLDSIKVSRDDIQTEVALSKSETRDDVYYFTMPGDDPDNYGTSVTVDANFVLTSATGTITIDNLAPEADKDTNNGYIKGLVNNANPGEEVAFQALANEGYFVENVNVSYNLDGESVSIDVTYVEGTLGGYRFTVPADLKDGSTISVNATFKPSSDLKNAWIKDESTGKWTYWKNGEQVTGWFKDGGRDWFYCSPEDGFLVTGWFKDGGSDWYYSFTAEDAQLRGNREGAMADNQWVLGKYDGKWYYLSYQGPMETNKWVRISVYYPWSWVGADGAWLYDYEG